MFQRFITKAAQSNAQIKNYKSEFSGEYTLLYAFKSLLSVFSIITAYLCVYEFFMPLVKVQILATIFTILALILVEGASFFTSTKAAKFLFRRHWTNTIIFIPFAIFSFALSFLLSTNGLEAIGASKVDNTTQINTDNYVQVSNIDSLYSSRINKLQKIIDGIKPPKYASLLQSDGSYSYTRKQQSSIDELSAKIENLEVKRQNKIDILKNELKAEIKTNELNKADTGNKYFWIIGLLLIMQMIASVVIGFMSKNIYYLDNTKDYIKQDIAIMTNSLKQQASTEIIETAKEVSQTVIHDFSISRTLQKNEQTENEKYRVAADGRPVETEQPEILTETPIEVPETETETDDCKIVLTGEQLDEMLKKEVEKHTKKETRKIGFHTSKQNIEASKQSETSKQNTDASKSNADASKLNIDTNKAETSKLNVDTSKQTNEASKQIKAAYLKKYIEVVRAIESKKMAKMTFKDIAKMYSVSITTVYNVNRILNSIG